MNASKQTVAIDTITRPFVAFLRESDHGGEYLVFNGRYYSVVAFASDEHAVEYRDGMAQLTGREWTFTEVRAVA